MTSLENSNHHFATTQWTLVWKAAEEDSQYGRPALTEVIRRYWQPLYSFARRRGLSCEDAEDATQEFLIGVMSGKLLDSADPAKGKFRAFLLTAWKRFLVDEYRKKNAARRGGNVAEVSLDVRIGEQKWLELQSNSPDPERVFMHSWATTLVDQAMKRLGDDYRSKGKAHLFDALSTKMTQSMDAGQYAALATRLRISASAIKVALHRLRQRFGDVLRELVSETVDHPSEIKAEMDELLQVLAQT